MKISKRRQAASPESTADEAASLSFEKALEAFLLAQSAGGHSKATYRDYKGVVGRFLRYMTETHAYQYIHQITEVDMLGWLAALRTMTTVRGRPYSSRSIETYSRDVSVFFHWLIQHGYLKDNPAALIKSPKVEKALIRVFTEKELELLDAACERPATGRGFTPDEYKALAARDRALLWLLLSTGVRSSEACGLLFSDIDWDGGMIYVRGKGAKERRIPIGKVARQHLKTYITYWRGEPSHEGDEHVFLNGFGMPLRNQSVVVLFLRLKRIAGITDKRVSAHTCRHWFAVNCIKNGMPSTVLQGLLGHEQLEMINTYVRLAEQDNRELYVKFSPVDSLTMHQQAKGKRQQLREWRKLRKQSEEK